MCSDVYREQFEDAAFVLRGAVRIAHTQQSERREGASTCERPAANLTHLKSHRSSGDARRICVSHFTQRNITRTVWWRAPLGLQQNRPRLPVLPTIPVRLPVPAHRRRNVPTITPDSSGSQTGAQSPDFPSCCRWRRRRSCGEG